MRNNRSSIGLGILLLVAGVILLLQNFDVFGPVVTNLVWTLLFVLGGLTFLLVFAFEREHWWALIPGCTLLGLAVLVGFGEALGALAAAIFMAAIGLSFFLIYAMRPEHWWAIIPGGSLFSVAALIAVADKVKPEEISVGIMFFGLALTFALVYLLPSARAERRWALIPAGILAVMGVLMTLTLGGMVNYIWPVALIIGGGFMLWRALRPRS